MDIRKKGEMAKYTEMKDREERDDQLFGQIKISGNSGQ